MFEFNIYLEVESRQKEKTQRSSSKVKQLHNYTIIQRIHSRWRKSYLIS